MSAERVLVKAKGEKFAVLGDEPEVHVLSPASAWAMRVAQVTTAYCGKQGQAKGADPIQPPDKVCIACREHTRPV